MAYDARSVANEFIRQAGDRPLSNMKLQKLVYIAHGYSLAILNKPLIKQSVEAWKYGPVVPDLYHALRQYKSGNVTEPINIIPDEQLAETDRALVANVLASYGQFSGTQLSTLTHKADTPWREVFQPNAFFNNDTVPDALIRKHYIKLLNERAGIKAA